MNRPRDQLIRKMAEVCLSQCFCVDRGLVVVVVAELYDLACLSH